MSQRSWRPSASLENIQARAELYAQIRRFFAERGVMEVDTPVLSAAAVLDPHLEPISLSLQDQVRYLQTSPEYPMKRLLAAGSGSIYQIAPVFRGDEQGRWHESEFRMLEWYRVGWDHHALMREVAELLTNILDLDATTELRCFTYAEAFSQFAALDPYDADQANLESLLRDKNIDMPAGIPRDELLDLIMGCVIGPQLGREGLCFVTDYPANQAALAKVRSGEPPVAERFEVYLDGIELANGYHELTDGLELRNRFETVQKRRQNDAKKPLAIDEALLRAMEAGLPDSAGVALGLDRLLAIRSGATSLAEVIAFPADRA